MRFVAWLVLASVGACHSTSIESASVSRAARPAIEVVASLDFPFDDARGHELSGITWDASRGIALAISDAGPRFVELKPAAGLRSWSFGATTSIDGVLPWDGEGIALAGSRLFIANERPPRVVEIDRDGKIKTEIALPPFLETCRPNRCLESLSASPDGRYLFTANESSIEGDGSEPTVDLGATVRILRFDLTTGARRQWAYETDTVCAVGAGGEIGVSDVVALGSDDLVVLERSYVPSVRNRVRLYRVHLDARVVPLHKELLLDFENLEPGKAFIPNYEGICLGPRLPDGRRSLLMVSDNNARPEQIARLLVLAVSDRRE